MAGTYPDAPGHRIPYDRDGSTGFRLNKDSSITTLTAANLQALNNEGVSDGVNTQPLDGGQNNYFGVVLPHKVDLVGALASHNKGSGQSTLGVLQTSPDTTNGSDGTWTTRLNPIPDSADSAAAYRDSISSVSVTGIVGVRVQCGQDGSSGVTSTLRAFHLYTSAPPNESAGLKLYHPVNATPVTGANFDWGDVARSTSADKQFRVHNPSALTAQSVALTTEALTGATPAVTSQHTFSFAGGAFDTTVNIGNISPGATSGVITVRRTIPSGAALGRWWHRIVAAAGSYV